MSMALLHGGGSIESGKLVMGLPSLISNVFSAYWLIVAWIGVR
jgi:hypothetical protein